MRTLLSFLLVISFVVILGVGGYYLRGQQETAAAPAQETEGKLPAAQTPSGGQNNRSGGTQSAGGQNQQGQTVQQLLNVQKMSVASQGPALDYFADKGNNIYVVQSDGKVTKTIGGKSEVLSNGPVAGIISASFSPDGKKILANVGSGSSASKAEIFDVEQKTWTLLPYVIQDMSWAPTGHQMVFLSPAAGILPAQAGASAVFTLDTDNPKAKPVEIIRIRQQDISLNWISPSKILLGDAPNSGWNSSLWSLDVSKKTLSPILADRPGLETIWSSSSPVFGLVFSAGETGQESKLSLVDENGKFLRLLVFLTLPSKCAFYDKPVPQTPAAQRGASTTTSSASTAAKTASAPKTSLTMVCAVPSDGQIFGDSFFPDAYQKKSVFTLDDLFEVDISTGNIKNVFSDPDAGIDASGLKIFNQSVFFINRYDQKVYSIPLPK